MSWLEIVNIYITSMHSFICSNFYSLGASPINIYLETLRTLNMFKTNGFDYNLPKMYSYTNILAHFNDNTPIL